MNIKLSQNIIDLVREKELAGIEINTRISGCCCGQVESTNTRLIPGSRLDTLRKRGYNEYDVDGIKVMVAGNIATGDEIEVRMYNFIGLKSFKVSGIKPSCMSCRT